MPPPWALCDCVRNPRDVQSAETTDGMRAHARVSPATDTPTRAPTPNLRYMVRDGALHKPGSVEDPYNVYPQTELSTEGGEEIIANRSPQYKPPVTPKPSEENFGLRNSPFWDFALIGRRHDSLGEE